MLTKGEQSRGKAMVLPWAQKWALAKGKGSGPSRAQLKVEAWADARANARAGG